MRVEDIMTRQPPVCLRGQRLVAATRIMISADVSGIPVLDSHHRVVGMLSVDDLVRWEANRDESRRWVKTMLRPVLVAHVMTHEVVSVTPDETIAATARVMRFVARSVLPVLHADGSLAGIVSAADIATASARDDTSLQLEIQARLDSLGTSARPGTINALVRDGTVTLSGAVDSHRDLRTVRRTVASVVGVGGIQPDVVKDVPARFDHRNSA